MTDEDRARGYVVKFSASSDDAKVRALAAILASVRAEEREAVIVHLEKRADGIRAVRKELSGLDEEFAEHAEQILRGEIFHINRGGHRKQ